MAKAATPSVSKFSAPVEEIVGAGGAVLADALAAGKAPGRDVLGGAREVRVAGVSLRKGTCVAVPPTTPLRAAPSTGAERSPKRRRGNQEDSPTTEDQVRRICPGPEGLVEVYRRPRDGVDISSNLSWWQEHHPSWVLYRCDRKTPATYWGNGIPLDLTNPEVLAWQGADGVPRAAIVAAHRFTGAVI